MRYDPAPSDLFVKNRERLAALMAPNTATIVHSNDIMPTNADGVMPFRQNNDLYYLTGVDQEETVLLFYPEAAEEKERCILFVRETNDMIAVWEGAKLSQREALRRSGIKTVRWTTSLDDAIAKMMPQIDGLYLLTNEHLRAASIVETRNRRFIAECQSAWPLHTYLRLAPLLHQLRMIKDEAEIEQLQKAVDITEKGFRRVLGFLKDGVGEWEVEAEFLHEFVRNRSRGFAYQPIIGAGHNACVLHYLENAKICKDGELVLMDVGAEWANWNADMTRTIPVSGTFSPRQKDVYNAVLRVLRAADSLLRPGKFPREYQREVLAVMTDELVGLGLIPADRAADQGPDFPLTRRYFMHGTSHHLGLDVHDVSPPNQAFEVGMVMTIEPGIYIPDEDLGIRIENDVVIGDQSNRNLFANIPIEVDEIEELMAAARK